MRNSRGHHTQRKMTKVSENASTTKAYKSWALRNKEIKKKTIISREDGIAFQSKKWNFQDWDFATFRLPKKSFESTNNNSRITINKEGDKAFIFWGLQWIQAMKNWLFSVSYQGMLSFNLKYSPTGLCTNIKFAC